MRLFCFENDQKNQKWKISLTMRWSEAGYLSQFVLTHALRQVSVSLIFDVRQKNNTMRRERMRSFRIYLPNGREPTGAGLLVIFCAFIALAIGFTKLGAISRMLPNLTYGQVKALFLCSGFVVIGIGWIILKLAGIPFSKNENRA